MRKVAELFASSPYTFMLTSTVLITLIYYLYSKTLPMTQKDVQKNTAKVAAVAFLTNMSLAYITSMGQAEPLSAEPFMQTAPAV